VINPEKPSKIIFTGPVGAGKTTAICSISENRVLHSEVKSSRHIRHDKKTTTVAMDYGTLTLDGGHKVHLYGTPGQQRFEFMWPILTKGGNGLILFLDNASPDPLNDMHTYLDAFAQFIQRTHVVIGITRCDVSNQLKLSDYKQVLAQRGQIFPVEKIDARRAEDVKKLVHLLLL